MDAVRTCMEEKTIVCGHWHTSYGHSKYEGKCLNSGGMPILAHIMLLGLLLLMHAQLEAAK